MKKFIAILLALVMVLSMAACSVEQTDETKATEATQATEGNATEATQATEPAPAKTNAYQEYERIFSCIKKTKKG